MGPDKLFLPYVAFVRVFYHSNRKGFEDTLHDRKPRDQAQSILCSYVCLLLKMMQTWRTATVPTLHDVIETQKTTGYCRMFLGI